MHHRVQPWTNTWQEICHARHYAIRVRKILFIRTIFGRTGELKDNIDFVFGFKKPQIYSLRLLTKQSVILILGQ